MLQDHQLELLSEFEFDETTLLYIYWRSLGMPPRKACHNAGLPAGAWRKMEANRKVSSAIQRLFEGDHYDSNVTRHKVENIIIEAIEIARRKDMPKVMIEGARALADVNGLNKQPQHVVSMQGAAHHPEDARAYNRSRVIDYKRMEPAQLEKLVAGTRILSPVEEVEDVR